MKKEEAYVLMFDESLNSVCQSKQMDIHIRSWNQDKQEVELYLSVYGSWHSRRHAFSFSFRHRRNSSQKSLSGKMLLSLCLGNLNKHNKRKIDMVISSLMTLPHRFRKYM